METKLYPWRIEGKATPFSPRMVIGYSMKLRDAIKRADRLKQYQQYYVTVVRPN